MKLSLPILAAALLVSSPAHPMTGDPEAIAMARRMIENMGGRERWARAKWIYAREDAWYANRASPGDAQYWRRADRPGWQARSRGPGWQREFEWEGDRGHRIVDGSRTDLGPADIQQQSGWWPGEIYTMYVRLAREDADLRLVNNGERSFRVLDARDGSYLGEYSVDNEGSLSRWRYGFGTSAVDYVYGPLRRFGDIKVPAWGALNDGTFRFFYSDFRLAERDEEAVFSPPR